MEYSPALPSQSPATDWVARATTASEAKDNFMTDALEAVLRSCVVCAMGSKRLSEDDRCV